MKYNSYMRQLFFCAVIVTFKKCYHDIGGLNQLNVYPYAFWGNIKFLCLIERTQGDFNRSTLSFGFPFDSNATMTCFENFLVLLIPV